MHDRLIHRGADLPFARTGCAALVTAEAGSDRAAAWDSEAVEMLMDPQDGDDPDVIGRAIGLLRQAVAAVAPGDPGRPGFQSNLGLALLTRFGWTAQGRDLDESVNLFRAAVDATADTDPDQVLYLSNLGMAVRARFEQTGELADLDDSIEVGRRAATAEPPDHPEAQAPRSNLGLALLTRFERTGDLADLDEAMDLLRSVVAATPQDHPGRAKHLSHLAGAAQVRFLRLGAMPDIEAAVAAARQAVAVAAADDPLRADVLTTLGMALRARYDRLGDPADLDEAITSARSAVVCSAGHEPERAVLLSNLSIVLLTRGNRTGSLADIDQAVDAARQALQETPGGQPDRAGSLSNLGAALLARFERAGDQASLDAAIAVSRQAVDATPQDHPDQAMYLSNLGLFLRTRFDHSGDLADLDEALDAGRRAVGACPEKHPDLAMYLSNLGLTLLTRFERVREPANIDEAVRTCRRAVAATPGDHPDLARFSSNLCGALQTRFEHAGDLADLRAAVAAGRRAVAATAADGQPDRVMHLSNLAIALWTAGRRTGRPADLDEAAAVAAQAVTAATAEDPRRAGCLSNLGAILRDRFRRTGRDTDYAASLDVFQQCALMATAAPLTRARAGRAWAELATSAGDWPTALRGFDTTLALLPQLADRRLGTESRQHHIWGFDELGTDAAATALNATGDPARALAALEQGRGILLRQGLETRSHTGDLRRKRSDLADEFDRLRILLNVGATTPLAMSGRAETTTARAETTTARPETTTARRRAAAHEWEQLVAAIRGLDGFADFLAPPTAAELTSAASDGAIVAINISRYRCDALIVTSAGIDVVGLPNLTQDGAADAANHLLAAVHDDASAPGMGLGQILAWLWDVIAEPVLERLGHAARPAAGQPWPRVWWLPTGPLTVLPLHAAGREHGTGGTATALDRVVSSYTPTIRVLHHGRQQPAPARSEPLLVAVPDYGHLTHPAAEIRIVAEHLSVSPDEALIGAAANPAAVLARLSRASWAHFACHADTSPDDPTESYVALHGGSLRVRDLAALHNWDAELAFLSSCSTAFGGTRLMDEAIHVSSAFQLAGFKHVIGTLWPVTDRTARAFASRTYQALSAGSPPALALHDATRAARAAHPDHPRLWAAHLHTGP